MDGTTSAAGAGSARRLPTQLQLSVFSAGDSSLHSGLFEQLLNMPPPAPTRPASSSPPPPADPLPRHSNDADSTSPAEASTDDSPRESQEPTAKETGDDVDTTAAEHQAALLAASVSTSSTTAVDEAGTNIQPANAQADDAADNSSDSAPETSLHADGLTAQPSDEEATANIAQSTETNSAGDSNPQLDSASAQPLSSQRSPDRDRTESDHTTAELNASQTSQVVAESGQNNSDRSASDSDSSVAKEDSQVINSATEDEPSQDHAPSRERTSGREKWYERSDRSSTFGNSAVGNAAEGAASSDGANQTEATSDRTTIAATANQAHLTTEALASASPATASGLDQAALSALAGTTTTAMASTTANNAAASTTTSLDSVVGTALGTTTSGDAARDLNGGQGSPGNEGVTTGGASTKGAGVEGKTSDGSPQRSDNLTQAERVRVVQRISRSFARLGPSGGQINIKLHPPQLGSLNVQVRMEGRSMIAKLSTESSAARDTILESLPVLRSRLAEQGFEIASFQVEVTDNNADPTSTGGDQSQNAFGQADADDSRDPTGRSVDYRRLAFQQRQSSDNATNQAAPAAAHELSWQMLAGMDVHA